MPAVLNVGGGSKSIAIPPHYDGWEHLLLDVDPKTNPDVLCDARNLESLEGQQFDAVYCSHNLEHYYRHDVPKVLHGFRHVLKQDGFAEVRVPNIEEVLRSNVDLEAILYESASGPIAPLDVIYGFGQEIERSGQDFYAHKTGFTPKSLVATMRRAGFPVVYGTVPPAIFEARALGFMSEPTQSQRQLLGLPETGDAKTGQLDVFIERGRVNFEKAEINLRIGTQTIHDVGLREFSWPFHNDEVDHLRCEHVLEYLTSAERMMFMKESGRVLRVGGTLLVIFYYATSRQASSNPMFKWPPLTEFSFDYFNRSWREKNRCDYPITCDFDFVYNCELEPSLLARNQDFKNFTTKHYNQSVITMHGLMTKRS